MALAINVREDAVPPFLATAMIIVSAMLLTGCVVRPPLLTSDDALVGCWRGEGYQPLPQRTQTWVTRRNADGTFVVEFQDSIRRDSNRVEVDVEAGSWVRIESTYTTVTNQMNGRPTYYRDEYEILELTADKFVYRHKKLGVVFTAVRVSCEAGRS